jgi:threonine dehydrogenase-like Zn-dependent dehydrogenase
MLQQTELHHKGVPSPDGTIHIIGAGPVGLLLTSILQSAAGSSVRL